MKKIVDMSTFLRKTHTHGCPPPFVTRRRMRRAPCRYAVTDDDKTKAIDKTINLVSYSLHIKHFDHCREDLRTFLYAKVEARSAKFATNVLISLSGASTTTTN